ncbi:zinc metalloprotease HtpX [Richelia sinica]|uniref:zinc metalloprotease HtpX n=1 Tax=Richelia sinica TaxID=1357545 RepID=UPI001682F2B7|nr:zinc metalloprotease HtpX [Richelia sinica]MBD2665365.1 M48 family metalloprotease [Richelia sinica FACHB-800]
MPSHAESSLEAGLVALKQGNYYAAITKLEPIAKNQKQENACLQAKVGLVMAYARTGEVAKAVALCQNLMESSNAQVQEWSKRALKHLKNRHQRLKTANNNFDTGVEFQNPHLDHPQANYLVTDITRDENQPLSIFWRSARRAKVWQPLRKPNLMPDRLIALGTFLLVFWLLKEMLKFTMGAFGQILTKLPFPLPVQIFFTDPSIFVLVCLLGLIVLSPWILDRLLAEFYNQRELSAETLNGYSREATRVIQRICQQRRWPMPQLRIVPLSAPLIFTYGNLARTARITVSQGLLEQLEDDEIAAVYALSLGQMTRWDFMVMSLVMVLTVPLYLMYQEVAAWANQLKKPWYWPISTLSNVLYGLWWLLTSTALFNSRMRLYHSDRLAAETTGNPNGLIRALLKIAIGIAGDVVQQESTCWELESLNLLAPVGYQQSLSLGSLAGYMPFESFLMWENANPYRQWFTINNSHPLMGDRLERLCQIARHWHLDTELHLINQKPFQVKPQSFLLQIAPWLGMPLGILFAGGIWLTWQLAYAIHLLNLKWIYDNGSFVTGCLLIGFSIGTFIRINSFFPNIPNGNLPMAAQLPQLLADPAILPIDSISVRLSGRLLGRSGSDNSLAQDLILQSQQGLVKLHHISWLGQAIQPQEWIGRQVIVTGWLRRGATPWIDIQTLENQSGKTINSPHPIGSTVLAVAAQALGAYILLTG